MVKIHISIWILLAVIKMKWRWSTIPCLWCFFSLCMRLWSHYSCLILFHPANKSVCSHGNVRLVGGGSDLQGRVEFCAGGEWTTICSNRWDEREASVVCRQLGHSGDGRLGFEVTKAWQRTWVDFLANVCFGDVSQFCEILWSNNFEKEHWD